MKTYVSKSGEVQATFLDWYKIGDGGVEPEIWVAETEWGNFWTKGTDWLVVKENEAFLVSDQAFRRIYKEAK